MALREDLRTAIQGKVLKWDAVAWRLDYRTPNREDPGSNYLATVSKFRHFRSLHIASAYMCTNSLRAAWLNASQRSRVGVGRNRSVTG